MLSKIKDIFQDKESFKNIIESFSWSFFDKVFQGITGLFITAWLARYLGPEKFGVWSYALAYIAVFASFSNLQIGTLLIKELVKTPLNKYKILGSAFFLKSLSAIIAFLLAIFIVTITDKDSPTAKLLITIMALSFLFQLFEIIDFYFKSLIKVKYTVLAKSIAFFMCALTKIILIFNNAPLEYFAWTYVLEISIFTVLLIVLYKNIGEKISKWRASLSIFTNFIKDGWPLFLAYIFSILYLKADQIMIGQILGEHAVGIYSISLKIYEIPFSILVLLSTTIFPKMIQIYQKNEETFLKRYSQLTTIYTISAIILFFVFLLSGKFLISLIFGSEYSQAYSVLNIHAIGLIFVYNGMLRSSYIYITSNEKILFYTSLISFFLNILLNFLLITRWGILGAAIATAITQFVALFLSNILFKQTRKLFFIQLNAFVNFPKIPT